MELTAQSIINKLRGSKFPRTDTTEILKAIKNAKLDFKSQNKLADDLISNIKAEDKDVKLKETIYQIAEILDSD